MPLLLPRRLPPLPMACGSSHHPVRCSAGTSLPIAAAGPSSIRLPHFRIHQRRFLSVSLQRTPSRTTVLFAALSSSGSRSRRGSEILPIARDIHIASLGDEINVSKRFEILEAKLKEVGIEWDGVAGKFSAMMCPKCQGGREQERSFSLFVREDGKVVAWKCHRAKCGWTGGVQDGKVPNQQVKSKQIRVITEKELQLEPLCEEIRGYLKERGISAETLRRNAVMQRTYLDQTVIAFTYRRDGVLVSCKYRGIPKKFWQEPETERVFYGLDDIKYASDIIIVEGEMDKLSMEEAGYHNCVSVPGGAPSKVSEVLPEEEKDTSFQYLWNCKEYLDKASRIIIATDADAPGQALAEEIARRLGKERCWRVNWPNKSGTEVYKDANEVLMYKGKDALKELIETAELYPIRGLFSFRSFSSEIDDYYHCRSGNEQGVSTGWRALNSLYNVVPGELTVITGVPNSGKSEWIDALLCNINETVGWTFALCSMENKASIHHLIFIDLFEIMQGSFWRSTLRNHSSTLDMEDPLSV
ncbi:twinkle-like protein, chloroplastic/mitochondrial [Iris pallida]|uniref:Twinkle-like protein, chloroplastic/mitochondrial n=1 Tax=Iris pallida TaxID=29817 RepID=A0AAX6EMS0_IRIPA|nr:twinkle-like protein, chloroplastic/mitochondrial [Iris pallida]